MSLCHVGLWHLWKGQTPFWPFLGQYPAAPCSPGPFVLLLIFWLFTSAASEAATAQSVCIQRGATTAVSKQMHNTLRIACIVALCKEAFCLSRSKRLSEKALAVVVAGGRAWTVVLGGSALHPIYHHGSHSSGSNISGAARASPPASTWGMEAEG